MKIEVDIKVHVGEIVYIKDRLTKAEVVCITIIIESNKLSIRYTVKIGKEYLSVSGNQILSTEEYKEELQRILEDV